jgi:uncharacterized protein (TIGR03435 family)
MRDRMALLAVTGFIAMSPLMAVVAPAQERQFDVVSVKKHADVGLVPPLFDLRGVPGGRVTIKAMSLLDIIQFVYPEFSRDHQVEVGPDSLLSDRFDIEATFEAGSVPVVDRSTMKVPPSLLTMLRAMLADRFKLRVHEETKEIPIYALVLARKDGRLGPRLKRSAIDCTPGSATSEKCGFRADPTTGLMTAVGMNIDSLASWLEIVVRVDGGRLRQRGGRPIEDMTGLTGPFDFTYEPRRSPDGPSIFTTIQDDYGLRLEPRTGMANILVIEHVEQPTPN